MNTIDEAEAACREVTQFSEVTFWIDYSAVYTAMGHTIASYADPLFRGHLAGAIRWVAGR